MLTDAAADLEPAQVGHHDVEQDERGVFAAHFCQALAPRASRGDSIALRAQYGVEQPDVLRRVVDDQDRWSGVHGCPRIPRSQCARTCPGNSLMLIGLLI